MLKQVIFLVGTLFLNVYALGQTANQVVSAVIKSQKNIQTATYKVVRLDTLVTDDFRRLTGEVRIRLDSSERNLGFLFWAKEEGVKSALVYNGNMTYYTDDDRMEYSISTDKSDMEQVLFRLGGRLIAPDVLRLDISSSSGLSLAQDKKHYYLTVSYPDIVEYQVINRSKKVTVDKENMIPVKINQHQETLGKVQDLTWEIRDIQLNDSGFKEDFFDPHFLRTHRFKIPVVEKKQLLHTLNGKNAPLFELKSFDNNWVKLTEMKGKVILLDFWEVWCGPCIESMPKVQKLYEKYSNKGLLVYGIINDVRQFESAKKMIAVKSLIKFPMLLGNEKLKKDYCLEAIPQYVLINRKGKISFLDLGYSDQIELQIEKAINEK